MLAEAFPFRSCVHVPSAKFSPQQVLHRSSMPTPSLMETGNASDSTVLEEHMFLIKHDNDGRTLPVDEVVGDDSVRLFGWHPRDIDASGPQGPKSRGAQIHWGCFPCSDQRPTAHSTASLGKKKSRPLVTYQAGKRFPYAYRRVRIS